jgi:hypothetical protein
MRRLYTAWMLVLLTGLAGQPALAGDEVDRLRRDNEELRQRVAELEKAVSEIRIMMNRVAEAAPVAKDPARESPAAAIPPPAKVEVQAPPVPPPVQIYGNIELDAAWDLDKNQLGKPNPDPLANTNYDISVRQSRLGARFHLPGPAASNVNGRVETDFLTSTGTETSPNLRLRHAYAEIDWAAAGFNLLGGQTWDVVAPLQTDTIGYPAESWTGDVGYRRPMLRVRQNFGADPVRRFTLEAAAAKAAGQAQINPFEDETITVRMPIIEGRAAGTWPLFCSRGSTFGVWGHWGTKRYNLNTSGDSAQLSSWSVGLDADVWLTPRLELMIELWQGVTLDTYYWGSEIEPGYGDTSWRGIEATGGWSSLTWRPSPSLRFNLGGGFDNPFNHELDGLEEYTHVVNLFGNCFYDFDAHWEVGVELSYWHASRLDGPDQRKRRITGTFLNRI